MLPCVPGTSSGLLSPPAAPQRLLLLVSLAALAGGAAGGAAAASASRTAEAVACGLCGVISDDLFKAAIGIQGAGFGPTGFQFKDQFGAGDMIDVIDSLCHIEATPDWDEAVQGLPPVTLQHGYVLWQDPEAGRYLVRRKDEIDESLIGLAMVEPRETTDIFFHACEQHIRTIDVEVADQFALMLKRHKRDLKDATARSDYVFKEQLAESVRTVACITMPNYAWICQIECMSSCQCVVAEA